MARSILFATLLLASLAPAARAGETVLWPRPERRSAAGVTVGLPQIIALSLEKETVPHLRLQGNLGTAGVLSSFSGRLILVADDLAIQPYGFLGGGVFVALSNSGGAAAPYGWYGLGVRLQVQRLIVFAEAGRMTLPGLFDAAADEHSPVGAVGLLVAY